MKWLCLLIGIFSWLTLSPAVFAQFSGSVGTEQVAITLDPQYPNPGDTVIATLEDYSVDTSGATRVWLVNGSEQTNLQNQRTVTFIAPAVGQSLALTAQLQFTDKPSVTASKTITPNYLDVIIEPQTYTPVFYSGRALPVHGGLVNLTALVSDASGLVNQSEYSYNWQLNGSSVYGGARKGGYRAQITVPYGRNSIVSVSVQDQTGATIARRLVNVPSVPVSLKFYELSTLYGLSDQAITDSIALIGNSTSIRAVPYYLDTRASLYSLFTKWEIDGTPITTGDDPFEISLRKQGVGNGRIDFEVRNTKELMQGDAASFTVTY